MNPKSIYYWLNCNTDRGSERTQTDRGMNSEWIELLWILIIVDSKLILILYQIYTINRNTLIELWMCRLEIERMIYGFYDQCNY